MPQLKSLSSTALTDDTSRESARPSPAKVSLTQRMAAPRGGPTSAPVQREIDPVAAAVQRARLDHDTAAAFGFLGGPAASIDESIVQMKADAHTGLSDDVITAHAAAGVAGGGGALPHLDAIQRSFGPHDVSGVRAHVGGAAADASAAIGAHAYASGNDVAFAREPGLFLAAHEAAHVVQQRQGVHLSSAVGQDGDPYERHADEVAAAVVRGESAADLLGAPAGGAGAGVQRAPVQRWTETAESAKTRATVTVTSQPSTVATFWAQDGSGGHASNPYGADCFYSDLKVAPHTKGYVSLDVFAMASMGDSMLGDYGWNTQHQIALNAIVDTSLIDGNFQHSKRPMNPTKLPDPGLELVGEHQIVDDGIAPKLMVRMAITPTGAQKDSSQTQVKGGADLKAPVIEKGIKGELAETWTSEKNWKDAAIKKEYAVLLVMPGRRTGGGGGGGGGGVSIQNSGNTTNNSGGNTYNNGGNTTNNSGGNTYNNGGNTTNNSGGNTYNNGGNTTNNTSSYKGGDNNVGGDKVGGDKVGGDKVGGDKQIGSNNKVTIDARTTYAFNFGWGAVAEGKSKTPLVPKELQSLVLFYDEGKSDFSEESCKAIKAYRELFEGLETLCQGDQDLVDLSPRTLVENHIWKYRVLGLASTTASEKTNEKISNDRASKTQLKLAELLMVDVALLKSYGGGETLCRADNGDNVAAASCRRVEVKLEASKAGR
jgi:hypothetical protein